MPSSCSPWLRRSVPLRAKVRSAANSHSIPFSQDELVASLYSQDESAIVDASCVTT